MAELSFSVPSISCQHCAGRITQAVKQVTGVVQVKVNLASKTVSVSGTAAAEAIKTAIETAGYPVKQ